MNSRTRLMRKPVYIRLGRRLGWWIALLCLLLTLQVFSPELRGQAITGSIGGSVQDQAELPIPGAQVTVRNDELGTSVVKQADPGGHYLFTLLPPGSYTVEATAKGFGQQAGHVVVQVEQTLRLDFRLNPAAVKVNVQVNATAPLVESVTSDMGEVVDHHLIERLPLNGRIFSQLVTLVPGAVSTSSLGFGDFEENPSAAGAITPTNSSVNGIKWSGNNYLIDGVANNEPLNQYINISPPLDSIEEFKVETMNPSAEYGVFGGALVNLTSRSGSNTFHGSLYEYLRNDAVNASDYFAQSVAPYKSNEFGGSLGGPIRRDKTFFFMDAQGNLQRVSATTIATVPTAAERLGNLANDPNIIYDPSTGLPFEGNVIPTDRLNFIAAQVANLYPTPTALGESNNFNAFTPTNSNQESFDVRVDHYLKGNTRLFARESMQERQFDRASPGNKFMYGGSAAHSRNQNAVIGFNKVFSANKALELRLGLNRYANFFVGPDHGILENNILGIPNGNTPGDQYTVGLAYFGIPGYLGTGSTQQGDGSNGTHRIVTQLEYTANFSWNIGAHSLKMGADTRQMKESFFGAAAPRGEFDFDGNVTSNQGAAGTGDGLASFLLGYPAVVQRGFNYDIPYVRIWNFGAFVQDDYRVNDRLTLNLGLRWDVATTPSEKYNRQANFDLATGLMDIAQPGNVGPNVDTYYGGWAPRVGFAYTPNHGKTAIRGGFGISYFSDNFGANGGGLENGFPFMQWSFVPNPDIFLPDLNVSNGFPAYSPPVVDYKTISPPAGFAVQTYTRNFRQDMVEMFNGGVQQQLTQNTLLEIAYVRTRGLHTFRYSYNIDLPTPGPGSIDPRRPYYSLNPNITEIELRTSDGDSVYNALQVKLDKRFSFGLQALVSYTWSRSKDDFTILDPRNNKLNWGLSSVFGGFMNADIPQYLVASYVYELPVGRGKHFGNSLSPVVDKAIGGWSVRGITTLHGGQPLEITVANSLLNTGGYNRADQTCSSVSQPGTAAEWFNTACYADPAPYQFGNAKIGSARGPGMFNWDLTLAKKAQIYRDRVSLEFNVDFFNAFNHPEFGNPATTLDAPGFGTVTYTALPNRQIQFGLRLAF